MAIISQNLSANSKKDREIFSPLLLEAVVNQRHINGIIECQEDRDQKIWVNELDLLNWKVPLPLHPPKSYNGFNYYQLDWYPHINYRFDQYELKIYINFPPEIFSTYVINGDAINTSPIRPDTPGVYFTYNIYANQITANESQFGSAATAELGLFNHFGVGTTEAIIYGNRHHQDRQRNSILEFIRLDSTWTLDQPEKIVTWRFGDAITSTGNWSGSARFAGIQYGTNFATQPYFTTYPLINYQDTAAAPSTVEMFINNMLRRREDVPIGPFQIQNIPIGSGKGMLEVISHDAEGNSKSVKIPYYAAPTLLKAGLSKFSYEAGFLRDQYGIKSNSYSNALATGTYKYGFTNNLTTGVHAEALSREQSLGLDLDYLYKCWGVFSCSLAASNCKFGPGFLFAAGFTHSDPVINYGFRATVMSKKFVQIGAAPGQYLDEFLAENPQSITNQVFAGVNLGRYGSIGANYTGITYHVLTPKQQGKQGIRSFVDESLLSASYNLSIPHNISLMIGFSGSFYDYGDKQFYAYLTYTPDSVHMINTYSKYQYHRTIAGVQLSKNPPLGVGYGYHLLSSNTVNNNFGGDVTLQTDVGVYNAAVYKATGKNSYSLQGMASGSLVYLSEPFLSRPLMNSFAVVKVPNCPNVRVNYQNQLMGRTNRSGNLLIPIVLPYQINKIDVDLRDLPLNVKLDTVSKEVIPYNKSGAFVCFNNHFFTTAILKLVDPTGKFIPEGARVSLAGEEKNEYVVGYDGELYIENLIMSKINGTAIWNNQSCKFSVDAGDNLGPIVELNEIICK